MGLIFLVVFIGVFSVAAMVLIATGTGSSQQTKKVLARLDSALATSWIHSNDEVVDLRKQELLSAVPWINRWLSKIELAPRLRLMLYQANLKWTAGGLILMCLLAFMVSSYLVNLKLNNSLIAILAGLVLGAFPFLFVLFKRGRRFKKFETELPESLDLMVSALRVGHSLNSALSLVSKECPDPVSTEFRICYDEQNYGLELRTAMDNLTTRVPLQDLKIVITAILIQKESGGNLAEVLQNTAHVIRERFRLKRQIMTHTAQGRLTGIILTLLPPVLGILIFLINPQLISLLWTRAIGIKLLWASLGMTILGGLWISKIVNIDV
ncbi:type II secretion system F family protein [Acidicapsa dinghuensis]|uniref:Type II secretion system F family protein n=1 Tax=Acidicapsa dinghuensis TaxID=2218256 RepID=A0ABW1EIV3_9BACT|nr:type II secretion system F family protein [Acidicapsa dinghuensis]